MWLKPIIDRISLGIEVGNSSRITEPLVPAWGGSEPRHCDTGGVLCSSPHVEFLQHIVGPKCLTHCRGSWVSKAIE